MNIYKICLATLRKICFNLHNTSHELNSRHTERIHKYMEINNIIFACSSPTYVQTYIQTQTLLSNNQTILSDSTGSKYWAKFLNQLLKNEFLKGIWGNTESHRLVGCGNDSKCFSMKLGTLEQSLPKKEWVKGTRKPGAHPIYCTEQGAQYELLWPLPPLV